MKNEKRTFAEAEKDSAKEIVLGIIKDDIKTDSLKMLSIRFDKKRAKQIKSSNFPDQKILDELAEGYKGISSTISTAFHEDRVRAITFRLYRIFQKEDLEEKKRKNKQ